VTFIHGLLYRGRDGDEVGAINRRKRVVTVSRVSPLRQEGVSEMEEDGSDAEWRGRGADPGSPHLSSAPITPEIWSTGKGHVANHLLNGRFGLH